MQDRPHLRGVVDIRTIPKRVAQREVTVSGKDVRRGRRGGRVRRGGEERRAERRVSAGLR